MAIHAHLLKGLLHRIVCFHETLVLFLHRREVLRNLPFACSALSQLLFKHIILWYKTRGKSLDDCQCLQFDMRVLERNSKYVFSNML